MDDAGHAAPGARLHGEHGPAAALGDEILLQVLAQAAGPDELLELLVHALPAGAQLDAQLAELWRCRVAQIGAVVLDRALDRLCERRERRVDRGAELPQERRGLLGIVEGGTRAERPADRVGHVPQCPGCEHAAKGRVRRGLTDVVQPFERRLVCRVEQRRPPRLSAPGDERPRRDRPTARASARARRRGRSRSRWRAAPRSPGTRGLRVHRDSRDECRPPRVGRIRSSRTCSAMGWRRAHTRLQPAPRLRRGSSRGPSRSRRRGEPSP